VRKNGETKLGNLTLNKINLETRLLNWKYKSTWKRRLFGKFALNLEISLFNWRHH